MRVVLPKYTCMKQEWKDRLEYVTHFYMDIAGQDQYVGVLKTVLNDITFYFIDNEHYFSGFALYDGISSGISRNSHFSQKRSSASSR